MDTPLLVLNLKTYPEATAGKTEPLVRIAKEVAEKHKKHVIVCPQAPELARLSKQFPPSPHFRIFAQHVDVVSQGAFTGSVAAETLLENGIPGSLLNHSEKKIGLENVRKTIEHARKVGLELIVCADSVEEAKQIAAFHPPCIAVEPPELIGKGVSVSTTKPEIVTHSVKEIKKISPRTVVLVGAGVSTAEDVAKSRELGAEGVLLASAYVKSRDPKKLLEEMLLQL